jgi:DNA-binding winged helix-turn-helix (wHTH) protein
MGTREGEAVRYIFDEFVLSPSEQRLRRGEQVVRLGGRPMEILTALVERAGQIVSKEDLTKRAWPTKIVDASNLTVNIAAIRRALEGSRPEKRFIATVSGQGYRFVEPVDIAPFPALTAARRHSLPPPDLHGRAEGLVAISTEVLRRPPVTITGPGGVGKTSLALAVGHTVAGRFSLRLPRRPRSPAVCGSRWNRHSDTSCDWCCRG